MTDGSNNPLVSVVIPTWNGRRLLSQCVSALSTAASELPAGEVEIIVVDDASTDGTSLWLSSEWPSVRVLTLSRNRGFAAAANAGIRAARSPWIALLNNDALPEPSWLREARLDSRPLNVAAVASKIVSLNSLNLIESAGDGYTSAGLAFQDSNGSSDSPRRVFSACAAAAFYRKSALSDVGPFEERLESYYEDVDLSYRLNLRGWHVVYEPACVVRHAGSSSYGPRSRRRLSNSSRNIELVFFSCTPLPLLLRSVPRHIAATLAQAALRAWQGQFPAFLAGKIEFVGSIPWVLRRRRVIQNGDPSARKSVEEVIDPHWFRRHVATRMKRPSRPPAPLKEAQSTQTIPVAQ